MARLCFVLVLLVPYVFSAPHCPAGSTCKRELDRIQSYLDTSIDPCHDFYSFACGHFSNTSSTSYDSPLVRREAEFHRQVVQLLENPQPATHALLSNDFYKTCLKLRHRNNQQELVYFIRSIIPGWSIGAHVSYNKSWTQLYLDTLVHGGVPVVFDIQVSTEPKQQILLNKALFLTYGAERTYGLTPNSSWPDALALYIAKTARLFGLASSEEQLAKDARDLAALQFNLIASRYDGELSGTPTLAAHAFGFNHRILKPLMAMLNISQSLPAVRLPLRVDNPLFWNVERTFNILNQTNSSLVAKFFGWQLMQRYASLMNQTALDYHRHYLASLSLSLSNLPTVINDCPMDVMDKLEMSVFRQYINRYFNSKQRAEVLSVAMSIRSSFESLIRTSSSINPETKVFLTDKLQTIDMSIGYPNWITIDYLLNRRYGLSEETFVAMLLQCDYFQKSAMLNRAVLKSRYEQLFLTDISRYIVHGEREWPAKLCDVSAHFYRPDNSMVLPATFLQSPYYEHERPYVFNFAMIGSIMANHFVHLVDFNFRQLLGMQPQVLACYENEISAVVNQTGEAIPEHLQLFNVTTLELIYDSMSLQSAFAAYKRHSSHAPPQHGLACYTPDQMFFIAHAQSGCELNPAGVWHHDRLNWRYRLNFSLNNSPQFSEAFKCPSSPNHHMCPVF